MGDHGRAAPQPIRHDGGEGDRAAEAVVLEVVLVDQVARDVADQQNIDGWNRRRCVVHDQIPTGKSGFGGIAPHRWQDSTIGGRFDQMKFRCLLR
jgi:hypothetical protein